MTTSDAHSDAATPPEAESEPRARPPAILLKLPDFEGPLDLLLHLIEREDLDITAVSLLAVTEQYLAQLRSAESINIAALADFIAMGARLLLLKSRALLPREEAVEDGAPEEEEVDPEALVAALQEYRRYRQAAQHLATLQDEYRVGYRREASPPELPLPTGLEGVPVEQLAALFRGVLERLPREDRRPTVRREPIRLRDRIARLVSRLDATGQTSFLALIDEDRTRVEVVVDFLAVLELIKARYLEATQEESFGDIRLTKVAGAPVATLAAVEEQLEADFAGT
ncbi:MAG: segregation/condensation protein A [Dehalococcoidia bacterium]